MSIVDEACEKFSEEQVRKIVACSTCKSDIIVKLGLRCSGTSAKRIIQKLFDAYKPDTSHFDTHAKTRKYKLITKICPVCKTPFETIVGHRDEKDTCSRKCANTFFLTGKNNGMAKKRLQRLENGGANYYEICWMNHQRKCVICGEVRIVDAHHYNGDHNDNRPQNFVPLCPTHHQYWHSKYRVLIEEKVNEYVRSRDIA